MSGFEAASIMVFGIMVFCYLVFGIMVLSYNGIMVLCYFGIWYYALETAEDIRKQLVG